MGWLSNIFKGSCHKVSDHVSASEDQCTVNEEDEDLDHAIALSLAEEEEEEEEKQKQVIDYESQLEEDEQLARALEESLKSVAPNIHVPFSTGYRICGGCHKVISFGQFLNCMGAFWHPECFRCHTCNLPISSSEFSVCGAYPYHKACYKEQYHPKCGVRSQFIPTNAAGLIEYKTHPYWDQKYCPAHEIDGTPRCCSCERMEAQRSGYISHDDGRRLCLECMESAVMDTNHCQPLHLGIQEFYESMGLKVEQEIPLLLVERQALNEAMEGERRGGRHQHMPETRGLCLSEEQTVTTVRRPKHRGNMNVITEPLKLTRRCEVTAILILYGLPRLLTGSILAHEMMHAWLRLRGFRMLSPQIEEGICQVLAYMWLETQLNSGASNSQTTSSSSSCRSTGSSMGKRSPFELKLGKFLKTRIESDVSPVYGDGFRVANQAVIKYGLNTTLDHLWMTVCSNLRRSKYHRNEELECNVWNN